MKNCRHILGRVVGRSVALINKIGTVDDKARPKSNFAQIASAFIALVALGGIYVQITLTKINALRASARQVYLAYSQATLAYPRLAKPNYLQLKADRDPTELIRYQIYVANMLTAYDEIFQITSESEWIASFRYDVVDHMPYLCEQNDANYYATFNPYTRQLINGEKAKYCSNLSAIIKSAPTYPPNR